MNEHLSICTLVQLHVCECRMKPYLVCLCLPLYLIVWVLYFLTYLYPSRPGERLLCVCVCVCARVCARACVRACLCASVWMLVVQSTPHSVRFCLWFSHSCSDGNKGLFIVWYTFFLNSLFLLINAQTHSSQKRTASETLAGLNISEALSNLCCIILQSFKQVQLLLSLLAFNSVSHPHYPCVTVLAANRPLL